MGRFEVVRDKSRVYPNVEIKLPTIATKDSAAFDIYSNETITINPQESAWFWTDVKVKLRKGEHLITYPRSSVGIDMNLMIANTNGLIDKDYYNNPNNDGNILVVMFNIGKKSVTIHKGDRFVQAVVYKHVRNTEDFGHILKRIRKGGIGSTGK